MTGLFHRLAIVNRGEAAMRLIHAVREFNRENDSAIRTLAIYTEPERRAMFVREADEAFLLGPASFTDARDGRRKNAYLDYVNLQRVLVEARADAVWLGWGFVAEHPEFADLCERLGVVFIGPTAATMRKLGDKIQSKHIAEAADVPVAAWSGGPVASLQEAREQAERIGLPLMVKATAGGGGRGIRAVRLPEELDDAFASARSEALAAFGDGTVFMERLIEGARHIEVQIIADQFGTVWPVGVRDCSVQRRNQKLVEESSSPVLDPDQEQHIRRAAADLCREAGYHNAGTVEFLYEPRSRRFSFMEVNARLQVEHPVTEMTTDLDLVKLQLHVARGGRLDGEAPEVWGRAIEVRLNAENVDLDFAPAPGRVELLKLPTGAGIRIDTGIEEGDTIPAEFDSMIAKIIAHGRNRNEAIARLRRALTELKVVVRGGHTNRAFLLELLGRPEVVDGSADVGWLDRSPPSEWQQRRPHGALAVLLAGIEAYEAEFDAERRLFLASAVRGRPKLRGGVGRTLELRHDNTTYRLQVFRLGDLHYGIEIAGCRLRVSAEALGRYERRLTCEGRIYRTISIVDGANFDVEIEGVPHRVSRDDGGIVRSSAPAVVVSIKVQPGDEVDRGDTLAVLEAMKLEMHVPAPFAGRVVAVDVTANEQVDGGAPLCRLKPLATDTASTGTSRMTFDYLLPGKSSALPDQEHCARTFASLHELVLGYDVDPKICSDLLTRHGVLCRRLGPGDPLLLHHEHLLLEQFADVCALSRRQPDGDTDVSALIRRSPQHSLFTYMRALDARGEGLAPGFVDDLMRALRHYRVTSLDPSPQLEEALLWIHKSHSRVQDQLPAVISVLEQHLAHIDTLRSAANDRFRLLLERLVAVSQQRYPAVCDLARELIYEFFDRTLFEQAREKVYREANAVLTRLAGDPQAADREKSIRALVQCPQPLIRLFSDRYASGDRAVREAILDCQIRRYYRTRELEHVRVTVVDKQIFYLAEYHYEGRRIHLVACHCEIADFPRIVELTATLLADVSDLDDAVVDFYVRTGYPATDGHDLFALVEHALRDSRALSALKKPARRIVVMTAAPGQSRGRDGQHCFTFRPHAEGYAEDAVYRDLHPMTGKRMHLWRLGNFALQRLPSADDVLLFHAVAHNNASDERLFALAEVHDLTPVRDGAGNLVALPALEYVLNEALAGMRLFQSRRPQYKRLHWNRVLLFIQPPLQNGLDDVEAIVAKLAPATDGLGLEKVVVQARLPGADDGAPQERVIHIWQPPGRDPVIQVRNPTSRPIQTLSPYRQKVVKLRQRGLHYPYEIIRLLTPDQSRGRLSFPPGQFIEYDLDETGNLVPVQREPGANSANVVVGLITSFTTKYPQGMTRVIVLGDPSRSLGSLAEAECRRIIAALDLAAARKIPLEWFAVSAGARISMQSGTENMDWIARVLRRLVGYTQAGGEVNLIVHGINVGAQPYWNAEATMLMHTRGVLIMTPEGAMVLTGKQALDYSGSVSAEDNFGIGGYDRIMGANGQAQYWAANIAQACRILLAHYDHTYIMPGERFPRRAVTTDDINRDVRLFPYRSDDAADFACIGEIFSPATNPGRKRPFDIRNVMRAVVDQDHDPLERWSAMQDAEMTVVWDAHLGGYPVCLVGLESRPQSRAGLVPADGPDHWTAGTLFPQSAKKMARAINSASANRPVVVLANLSGFDGSPESMRRCQLEYGAEIGRAVVNFRGPFVFCVISRYHGGAFVVFSRWLNDSMEVAALEDTYASVIGGAPAAAVVFGRDVKARTAADPRITAMQGRLNEAASGQRAKLRLELADLTRTVQAEKFGEVADQFDGIHSIDRALKVGSIDTIVPPAGLRAYLTGAVERGLARASQVRRDARLKSTATENEAQDCNATDTVSRSEEH